MSERASRIVQAVLSAETRATACLHPVAESVADTAQPALTWIKIYCAKLQQAATMIGDIIVILWEDGKVKEKIKANIFYRMHDGSWLVLPSHLILRCWRSEIARDRKSTDLEGGL